MSIVDKLLKADRGDFFNTKTEKFKAVHMSEILGEDVMVTIKEVSGDLYTEISSRVMNDDGTADFSKSYDVNAMLCVEGVVEPNLKDEELMKHFGCVTAKDLAKVIFKGGEVTRVADKITALSGFSNSQKDTDKEIKNS